MKNQPPFVTAVCVTGKEEGRVAKFLPAAIDCFHRQTYPADCRELLIVADGCFDLLPFSTDNVRVVAVQSKKSLGELRNIGLDKAHGNVVTQWDDDDHYREDRMALQVEAWKQNPGSPVLLQYQLCYDWGSDTAAVRFFDNTGIHGSILHPKTDARYPHQGKEEDSVFLGNWPGFTMLANDPAVYVRFAHPGSTWDAQHTLRHFGQEWARGQWWLGDQHRAYLRQVLALYGGTPQSAPSEGVPELVQG
jgi:glycosyltransferase involved in cell wall biosynthesis